MLVELDQFIDGEGATEPPAQLGDERLFDAQQRWLILDRRGCQNPLAFAPLLYRSFK